MDKSYLSEFITPVVDRTLEDIIFVRGLLEKGYRAFTDSEKTLWNSDLKGALNVSDLNRIENNIYVLGKCLEMDIDKITYTETDIPTQSNFERIYNNLSWVRTELSNIISQDLPEIPLRPYNTYEKYNDIESIIYYMYNIIKDL